MFVNKQNNEWQFAFWGKWESSNKICLLIIITVLGRKWNGQHTNSFQKYCPRGVPCWRHPTQSLSFGQHCRRNELSSRSRPHDWSDRRCNPSYVNSSHAVLIMLTTSAFDSCSMIPTEWNTDQNILIPRCTHFKK